MTRVLFTLIFSGYYAFSTTPEYFRNDLVRSNQPIVTVTMPFAVTPVDISMYTQKPITAIDEYNQSYTLPLNTELIVQTTLDQLYEGFKRPFETQSMYSRDARGEYMNIPSADALRVEEVIMDLIRMKQQEIILERLSSGDSESSASDGPISKRKKELVEVQIKKEGELKKVKVDLEKAIEEKAVKVQEDEVFATRVPTDYNGSDTWAVTPQTQAADLLRCIGCGTQPREDIAAKLQIQTVNDLIKAKAKAFSSDRRTIATIAHAKRHKKTPEQYRKKENRPQCYKYVKDALEGGQWWDKSQRLAGVSARYAGTALKEKGFINLLEDPELRGKITEPSQAPKGAILVYEPNPADRLIREYDHVKKKHIIVPDHGHVEIKTTDVGSSGYISDYESDNARTGKSLKSVDRKLVGIYIKGSK